MKLTDVTLVKNIVINVPNLGFAGGVAMLYQALDFERNGRAKYFCIHDLAKEEFIYLRIIRLVKKYVAFFRLVKFYDLIVLNPSLDRKSFFRESVFVLLAYLRKKKVVVFWHGWEDEYERKIRRSIILTMIFKWTYAKADGAIVLGTIFKRKLIGLGVDEKSRFLHFLNIADDRFLKDFNIKDRCNGDVFTILFLSRIEKEKGIYIAIDAYRLLHKKLPEVKIKLVIAGDGKELKKVRQYIEENNVQDVLITGFVSGIDKHKVYKNADLFLFPSSYGEGLPLSVMEAMLYGMPVISRPVGGLPDVIRDDINGYLIDSVNAVDFMKAIEDLFLNRRLYHSICVRNHDFALNNLTASKAKGKLSLFLDSI